MTLTKSMLGQKSITAVAVSLAVVVAAIAAIVVSGNRADEAEAYAAAGEAEASLAVTEVPSGMVKDVVLPKYRVPEF